MIATTTRSRVSHVPVMPCGSRYSSSASSTRSATHISASSRSAARLPDAEVVARARRRPSPACRCCRAPSAAGAPRASGRRARPGRRARTTSSGIVSLLLDAGDLLDDVVHRLEVLDVDGRDHVDPGVEQLLDVLPALLVARPGDVACARARRRARPAALRARTASRSISSNVVPRYSMRRRGTTSRSPICAAVFARPWVST